MKNRGNLEKLFRAFMRINFTLCNLYQDVTFLSYAEERDIIRDKKDVVNDLNEIQEQIDNLCKLASINELHLDQRGVKDAVISMINQLNRINSLEDVQNYVRNYQDRLHENDLTDVLAYKILLEISTLYSELCRTITHETVYPYVAQPFLATYNDVNLNPQSAIQQAFVTFEDYLRLKTGMDASTYGEDLINRAFGREGVLVYSEIPAEQNGVRNLFSGFYATYRNPNMHRLIDIEENQALAIISTLHLLLSIIDNSKRQ